MGTNRSTFLHLGEKKTKLISESESSLLKRQKLAGPATGYKKNNDKSSNDKFNLDSESKDDIVVKELSPIRR